MFAEGEEEVDASFFIGGENDRLIMDGREKSSAGPPEKTTGE
jgi:hypothetical protein